MSRKRYDARFEILSIVCHSFHMDEDKKEPGKYVSKKGSMRIANCPHCRGVLFKEINIESATGEVSFIMRCPHCQKNIIVTINHEISLRMPL